MQMWLIDHLSLLSSSTMMNYGPKHQQSPKILNHCCQYERDLFSYLVNQKYRHLPFFFYEIVSTHGYELGGVTLIWCFDHLGETISSLWDSRGHRSICTLFSYRKIEIGKYLTNIKFGASSSILCKNDISMPFNTLFIPFK